VTAGLLLALFVQVHNRLQHFLTRVIFLRPDVEEPVAELRQVARSFRTEDDYLQYAAQVIARSIRATRFSLTEKESLRSDQIGPAPVDVSNPTLPTWAQAVVPFHFSRGDARFLQLGERDG